MAVVRILKQIVGWLVIIPSVPFVFLSLMDLWQGDATTEPSVLVGMAVFFGLVSAAGLRLILSGRATPHVDPEVATQHEAAALRLAVSADGTLGPAELAAQGGMSFADAKLALDRLCKQGACEVVVTDQGAVLYRFHDLLPRGEGPAKDLLE